VDDMRRMDIGHIVDFIIEYNEAHDVNDDNKATQKPKRRKATQADWDAFFG